MGKHRPRSSGFKMEEEVLVQFKPKKKCPHIAAEVVDLRPELVDEFTSHLTPWAARVATSAGRTKPAAIRIRRQRPRKTMSQAAFSDRGRREAKRGS